MSIVLTDLIKEQALQCGVMMGAGVAFMLFYRICSVCCRAMKLNKWIRAGLELFFWLAAAVMLSQFLYYCAQGSLSVHTAAAFAAGVLLWKKFFCGIISSQNHSKELRAKGFRKRNGEEKKKQSV